MHQRKSDAYDKTRRAQKREAREAKDVATVLNVERKDNE